MVKSNSKFQEKLQFPCSWSKAKKKQEAHGPHRSPELTAVNMYM